MKSTHDSVTKLLTEEDTDDHKITVLKKGDEHRCFLHFKFTEEALAKKNKGSERERWRPLRFRFEARSTAGAVLSDNIDVQVDLSSINNSQAGRSDK